MQLEKLTLRNFRNIEATEFRPHPVFNIFYGSNAQGKTNLLESIYLLGSLKNFRSARNDELITHGETAATIIGCTRQNDVGHEIRLDINKEGKQARLDGKVINRPESYLSCLRPVVFAPEVVGLIKGPPAGRRQLVDRAVFQADAGYLENVQTYSRQLKQRNRLLKTGGQVEQVETWSSELARTGARIRYARAAYLERLIPRLLDSYRNICGEKETISLNYRAAGKGITELEQELLDEYGRQLEQELRYQMTLCGPHRDDIEFMVDGRPLRNFGSQGQQRSFILAFKTAQALDLQQLHGEPPLLLLDDLTGELDKRRQERFYQFLLNLKTQVFITATDIRPLHDGGIKEGYFIRVKEGNLHNDKS
ncbi:MAG: DNA replication and repair protein RecF [Desulfuromonas sp.]|nr:MAG: DNA replication and repair protein RecF [Desulfuromonas sp.]